MRDYNMSGMYGKFCLAGNLFRSGPGVTWKFIPPLELWSGVVYETANYSPNAATTEKE